VERAYLVILYEDGARNSSR